MTTIQTATASAGLLKVGDIVSMPVLVYSRLERALAWLLAWRRLGRIVAALAFGWTYRPRGTWTRREYRITEDHGGSTVTVEPTMVEPR